LNGKDAMIAHALDDCFTQSAASGLAITVIHSAIRWPDTPLSQRPLNREGTSQLFR
jgi:hypothetical protein